MQGSLIPIVIVVALATALAACGGSSKSGTATPSSASTPAALRTTVRPAAVASRSATPAGSTTAPATRAAAGENVELIGIVGTISASARVIQVTRLSGANVNQIAVQDSTRIRTADGNTATFTQIRTSDRIIASGRLSDRGDAIVADTITIQPVVPGAEPGG